jgi:hypothetical protein
MLGGTATIVLTPTLNVDWLTPIPEWIADITITLPGMPGVALAMPGVAVMAWAPPWVI